MNDKNTNINEEYLEIFQQLICEQLARAELLKEGSLRIMPKLIKLPWASSPAMASAPL